MNNSETSEEIKQEGDDLVLPTLIQQTSSHRKTSNLLKSTLRAESSSSLKNAIPPPSLPFFERRGIRRESDISSERISFGINFTPFKYPGSIEEALFHEKANLLGEIIKQKKDDNLDQSYQSYTQQYSLRDKSKVCPCCGKMVKDVSLTFFNFNYNCINEKYGGSLSYLFQVNKIFILTILLLIIIYFIYFQVQTEKLCSSIREKSQKQNVQNSVDYHLDSNDEYNTQYNQQNNGQDNSSDNQQNNSQDNKLNNSNNKINKNGGDKIQKQCLTLLRLSIISEVQLRRESDIGTQIMLTDLKFLILLILQISNIFFFQSGNLLKRLNKIKQETRLTKLRKKSLLIKYLPEQQSEEEVVKNLQLIVKNTYNVNVKVACITHIYDIHEKHKLVAKRMNLLQKYYRATNLQQKNRVREQLIFNYSSLKYLSNENSVFAGSLIITFLSEKDTKLIYNLLKKSYFLQVVHDFKRLINLNKDQSTRRIVCEKAPELSEILWQNIGYLGQKKQYFIFILFLILPQNILISNQSEFFLFFFGRRIKNKNFNEIYQTIPIQMIVGISKQQLSSDQNKNKKQQINSQNVINRGKLSFLLLGFTMIIFIGLPRLTQYLYQIQFEQNKSKESFKDKAIDYFVSFLLFVISNLVWMGMKYLLTKSKQATTLYESIYMVICNFAFHLQFYIIVPIFLSYFSQEFQQDKVDYDKTNLRIYGIVTLISGFSALSLIEVFFGPAFIMHRFRKWRIQKKQKQYFQQILNSKFERPNFPLEKRVLILYKQYTFGIIISFICPLAWLFVLGGLVMHFIGNRVAIIHQYTLYTYCNYKIVSVATRIASIAMMYVVTISYLLTEQFEGFYTRDIYIYIAKYMLVFNVFINTIFERVFKAIKKRRRTIQILQKKIMKREKQFDITDQDDDNLYAYYNRYQEMLGKIHPSWSDDRVEHILHNY